VLDLSRDALCLRRLVSLASLLLVASLAWAAARELGRDRTPHVLEIEGTLGEPDRCLSCHTGVLADASVEAHGWHALARIGCGVCHGGTPRALEARAAHRRQGELLPDVMMQRPGIESSCARCHPPGIRGADHLARGARLYLGLGCAVCHGGLGSTFGLSGPELRQIMLRPDEVRRKLLEPGITAAPRDESAASATESSPMPSYQDALGKDEQAMADLVTFVRALALAPLRPDPPFAEARCDTCHARGSPSGRYVHTCPFLQRSDLACARCHAGGPPDRPGDCPRIEAERPACSICHRV
jgi:hypothetical protein